MKNTLISKPFWLIALALLVLVPSALAQTATLAVSIDSPANNSHLTVGQATTFTATAIGGDGNYTYLWNFGDNDSAHGSPATKAYTTAGSYPVQVTVTDFSGNQATASISVAVDPVAAPAISVSIAAPANNTHFSLNQTINFSATAIGGDGNYTYLWNFGDNDSAHGSPATKAYSVAGTYPVQATVTDLSGAQASGAITVIVDAATSTPAVLTISDLHVTDIGTDRATVRWTTNLPADSRVIYDTVSHPDISTASAPNFSYANSTGTSDTTLVTDHAVTVTGLAPSTQYFFRALSQRP